MNLMCTGHIYLICRCTFIGKRWVWKRGFICTKMTPLPRFICTKMTPPPNLGHFWVVFEGWSQILFSTKLFRHRFEQSCSAMATQKLEEKVQQQDEVVESSKPRGPILGTYSDRGLKDFLLLINIFHIKQTWLQKPIEGTNLENICPWGVSKYVCSPWQSGLEGSVMGIPRGECHEHFGRGVSCSPIDTFLMPLVRSSGRAATSG